MREPGKRAWGMVLPVALLALVGMAGCSDDDEEGTQGGEARAEFADYCAKALRIHTYPEPAGEISALAPPQQAEVYKSYAAGLLTVAEPIRAAAPEAIRDDVNLAVDALAGIRQTGDLSRLEEEGVVEANERIHDFELDNCGWARSDVEALEYAFRGTPASPRPGPRSFELQNDGMEPHELLLFRVNDGVNDSLQQILDLPQAQAATKVRNFGSTSAEPGKSSFMVADLSPGRYAMVCFVPVGGAREGPPHFTRGMRAEFQVA